MASLLRSTIGLIVTTTAVLISSLAVAEPGLNGAVRNNFVESGFRACFAERDSPGNKGISVAVIAQYCVCYVDRMADQLSNDDVQSLDAMVKTDPSALKAKMAASEKPSAETCAAIIRAQELKN
jgi:hypothetical protein